MHMLNEGILFQDSGIMGIGPFGERLYGAKNFMPLMSVFDTPFLFQVICGVEELGWVHPLSFAGFGKKPVVISLGGRGWELIRLDEERSIAYVRAAEAPGRSRWLGGSRALSSVFCSAIRSLLLDKAVDPLWSKRAQAELREARLEAFSVRDAGRVVETDTKSSRTRWWTFGGLKANYSLALMLRSEDGAVPGFDNFLLRSRGQGPSWSGGVGPTGKQNGGLFSVGSHLTLPVASNSGIASRCIFASSIPRPVLLTRQPPSNSSLNQECTLIYQTGSWPISVKNTWTLTVSSRQSLRLAGAEPRDQATPRCRDGNQEGKRTGYVIAPRVELVSLR